MPTLSLPPKPAPYPGRYNGIQAIWLIAVFALMVLAALAWDFRQSGYLANALIGFYLARLGLEDPKPKEAKKP
jgi:hypothetical protein